MINSDSLNAAEALTSIIDSRNMMLEAIPGTPLAELVKATRSDSNFTSFNETQQYDIDKVNIEFIANAQDPILKVSPHDLAMDSIVEVAAKAVQSHVAYAKTVVMPAVCDIVEKTMQTLSALTPSSLLGMEIVIWSPPAPMRNSAFESSVRKFEETPYDSPRLNMRLPSIPVSDIKELLKTGTAGLDKTVEEWAAAKGDTFFINLWESVFQLKQAELNDNEPLMFTHFTEDKECGLDNAVAIYLLARRLVDEPLPGTEMNLATYTDLAADYRNQAGARICRGLNELDNIAKNKVLVRSTNKTITIVNDTIYRAWIEAGGDNEVLFGNLLHLPAAATVDQINAKASELKTKWLHHATLTATVESNKRFNRTKDTIHQHFHEQLATAMKEDPTQQSNVQTMVRLFEDELDDVREADLDDLWGLCLKLICRSRFYRTEAERILSGIERMKKQNPNMDVREAATISVIEYTAFWLSTQMRLVSV